MNGEKHGKGMYSYNSKITYKGDYNNGVKEGDGTIYNDDNSIAYSGQFQNGLPNGRGFIIDNEGNQVESLWKDGVDYKVLNEE